LFCGIAAVEKDLWATASVNEDVAKALTVMLGNFRRLRSTDEATQSIVQLVGALKAGNEVAQEAALNALYLLQEDWPESPAEVGKAQALAAAEAIPILQYLVREGPPRFQEKAEILLQCLPGSLVVTVKQGHNLKQSVGSTNAFCKLTLGNGPPRQTKVRWSTQFWVFGSWLLICLDVLLALTADVHFLNCEVHVVALLPIYSELRFHL